MIELRWEGYMRKGTRPQPVAGVCRVFILLGTGNLYSASAQSNSSPVGSPLAVRSKSLVRLVLLTLLLLCAAVPGIGQDNDNDKDKGKLSGVVRDPYGNVIVTAMVMLTNDDTMMSNSDPVDVTGLYAFGDVAAGRYTLTFRARS